SASAVTSSRGPARRASMATRAADAAAAPRPTPSTAATSASRWLVTTSAWSPDRTSPATGRPVMYHSIIGVRSAMGGRPLAQPLELVARAPLAHRDRRAPAHLGLDREVVHEPPCAREPEAEAVLGGIALAHRPLDVGDTRAPVAGHDYDPGSLGRRLLVERDLAAACVDA